MELSNEQYNQVIQYVDGEMNAIEQQAFESMLAENKELCEEVEFYKDLRAISELAAQKLDNTSYIYSENKNSHKDVLELIKRARQQWETNNANDLRIKYEPGFREPENTIPNWKVRKISTSTWLAAAVLTGLLIGTAWLYLQNNKKKLTATTNQRLADTMSIANNKKNDTGSIDDHSTAPLQNSTAPEETKQIKRKHIEEQTRKTMGLDTLSESFRNTALRNKIFSNNFRPDSIPEFSDRRLQKAFNYYSNNDYKQALSAFDADKTLVKRGPDENKQLIAFYTSYYKAQSYMGVDSVEKAISYLENAIAESPDNLWKNKARWYLLLAYIKTGNYIKTRKILRQLAADAEAQEYRQKAIELMKEFGLR